MNLDIESNSITLIHILLTKIGVGFSKVHLSKSLARCKNFSMTFGRIFIIFDCGSGLKAELPDISNLEKYLSLVVV